MKNLAGQRTLRILDYIQQYQREHGYAPTIREMCTACNIPSTSTVNIYLNQLVKQGILERSPKSPRALHVVVGTSDERDSLYRQYADLSDRYVAVTDDLKLLKEALMPLVKLWAGKLSGQGDDDVFAVRLAYTGTEQAKVEAVVSYAQIRRVMALVGED